MPSIQNQKDKAVIVGGSLFINRKILGKAIGSKYI
jgi:hypothetical protein